MWSNDRFSCIEHDDPLDPSVRMSAPTSAFARSFLFGASFGLGLGALRRASSTRTAARTPSRTGAGRRSRVRFSHFFTTPPSGRSRRVSTREGPVSRAAPPATSVAAPPTARPPGPRRRDGRSRRRSRPRARRTRARDGRWVAAVPDLAGVEVVEHRVLEPRPYRHLHARRAGAEERRVLRIGGIQREPVEPRGTPSPEVRVQAVRHAFPLEGLLEEARVATFRVGLVEPHRGESVRCDLDRAEELELLPRQGGDGETLEFLADRAPVVGRRPLRELLVGVGLQRFHGAVELVLLAHVRFLERGERLEPPPVEELRCALAQDLDVDHEHDGRHRSGRRCRAILPRLRGRARARAGRRAG